MTIKPMNIILIGAIIVTIGGFIGGIIVAYGTFKQNQSSSIKTDSIKLTGEQAYGKIQELEHHNNDLKETIAKQNKDLVDAYKELDKANVALSNKSDQIIDSTGELTKTQAKLIDANEKNEKLQTKLFNQVTSAGAVPVLYFSGFDYNNYRVVNLSLETKFRSYPVKDVRVEILPGPNTILKPTDLVETFQTVSNNPLYNVVIIKLNDPSWIGNFSSHLQVKVSWSNYEYEYDTSFKKVAENEFEIKEVKYIYKTRIFPGWISMIQAIQKEQGLIK